MAGDAFSFGFCFMDMVSFHGLCLLSYSVWLNSNKTLSYGFEKAFAFQTVAILHNLFGKHVLVYTVLLLVNH